MYSYQNEIHKNLGGQPPERLTRKVKKNININFSETAFEADGNKLGSCYTKAESFTYNIIPVYV
jgi:hypothetical protein